MHSLFHATISNSGQALCIFNHQLPSSRFVELWMLASHVPLHVILLRHPFPATEHWTNRNMSLFCCVDNSLLEDLALMIFGTLMPLNTIVEVFARLDSAVAYRAVVWFSMRFHVCPLYVLDETVQWCTKKNLRQIASPSKRSVACFANKPSIRLTAKNWWLRWVCT